MKPTLVVAAALVTRDDGCLLVTRRRPEQTLGGLWEFPGGKLERRETAQECLVRELDEELALPITVGGYFSRVTHEYDFAVVDLSAYWAEALQADFRLQVHDSAAWTPIRGLLGFRFAPADIPIVRRLLCVATPS